MAEFLVSKGLQSAYNLIESKNENTVYFCTDTGNMYLGDTALFESNAAVSASISGKTVTFKTHGANGTQGSFTLNLSSFASTSELTSQIGTVNSTISSLQDQLDDVEATANAAAPKSTVYTKGEVDSKISAQVASTFKYKGSCAYDELPKSGAAVGDVWNVTDAHGNVPAGTNYAWSGKEWDALAGVVDLSPYLKSETASSTYATKTELTSGLAGKANTSHTHTTSQVTDLQSKLNAKLDKNAAITASSTPFLVTYDADGLVLSGRAIAAGDIPTLAISKISGLQSALDAKVPATRKVNGKALSADVTIGGADITVGGDGDHASDTVAEAIAALESDIAAKPSTDTNTTYTFTNGTNGSFKVTPSSGSAQTVTIGKPSTAGTADKVGHGMTVSLNGTAQTKFDGSADVAFNITAASVGAAAASHTHTKAQITDFDDSDYATAAQGTKADSAVQTVRASNTGTNISIAAAKSGTTINLTPSLTTSTVSSGGSGLVIASDVKSYVDSKASAAKLQWGSF